MPPGKLRVRLSARFLRRQRAAAACLGIALAALCLFLVSRASRRTPAAAAQTESDLSELKDLDLQALRTQAKSLEDRVRRLEQRQGRLFPGGPAILVDSAENQISLVRGANVVVQGRCSTGSGLELADPSGKRSWTFETPRGHFRVLSKVANPVWTRPDWAFIEEGEPIPKDRASRAVPYVLGDYAIAFGDGYFIHGTLYTRLLGSSVTHGCIRVDDDILQQIYKSAQPGMPIWIY